MDNEQFWNEFYASASRLDAHMLLMEYRKDREEYDRKCKELQEEYYTLMREKYAASLILLGYEIPKEWDPRIKDN